MKNGISVLCLLLVAASGVRGDVLWFDEAFSTPAKWQVQDKKTEFQLEQGVLKVAGGVFTDVKVGEMDGLIFKAGAKIYLNSGQSNMTQGALVLQDKKNNRGLNFYTVFRKPGAPADTCLISINGKGETQIKVVWDQWYQIKVEVSADTAKLKIWQEGATEPSTWLVESPVPLNLISFDAIGFSTTGTTTSFKDLSAEFVRVQEPVTVLGDATLKATIGSLGLIKKLEVNRAGNWERVDWMRQLTRRFPKSGL